jgi:hypothetical protein
MPLYAITPEGLAAVPATSFETEGLREPRDIEPLIRDNPECLEEGLLVLAQQFAGWADSRREIDLLCLDMRGNLVVVELKRTEDAGHADLQALRYAAMVSAMTFEQAAATLARYRNKAAPDHDAARAAILEHLGWESAKEEGFAADTRIILAAHDFGKELTTTVLWLREREIDIRCIRLRPYRLNGGPLLLDVQPIIPLPETAAFQTQIGEKQAEQRRARVAQEGLLYRFWSDLLTEANARTQLHASRRPSSATYISVPNHRRGLSLCYSVRENEAQVELTIENDPVAFQTLRMQQAAIEMSFGDSLDWYSPEGQRRWRIRFVVPGGYRSPEEEWPALHQRLIDAMIRLDQAFRQPVAALP